MKFISTALLLFFADYLFAQQHTIAGYIVEANSKERIVGATVYAPFEKKGVISNNYGYFSITLSSDTATLYISNTGFLPVQVRVSERTKDLVTFSLQSKTALEEVVVKASARLPIEQRTQMSQITIPVTLIKNLPRFLGETDVFKTIQTLPGVSQGVEGTSGILVRGGGPDQNLILLDGTPIYNPQHILGIFSTFNGDAIKNVELYKGGFPARFGGKLSSVVDIVTKDGDMQNWHGEGGIGILASRLTLEGPIKKDKTSILLSGRRTYLDLIAAPFIASQVPNDEALKLGVFFYDLNMKLNHVFDSKNRLFVSLFSGQDFFKLRTKFTSPTQSEKLNVRLGFGNFLGTIRWNHVYNKKLFSNTLINFTNYRFVTSIGSSEVNQNETFSFSTKYYSGITDMGSKIDFEYKPNNKHNIKFGTQLLQHVFTPGALTVKVETDNIPEIDTAINKSNQKSVEGNIYFEDDWMISKNLKANIGTHSAIFRAKTKTYASIQPRFSFRYLLPNSWAVKVAYSRMSQFIHLLTNNTSTLPTDLWVPSTDKVKPMISNQIAVGFAKTLWDDKYEFSIEAYTKDMKGVIEYQDGASYLNDNNADWDEKVEQGNAKSRGIEILLQKKTGKTTGWVGYTSAKTTRKFEFINNGNEFPFKYDRRHEIDVALVQQLSKHWTFSMNWSFSSAAPFSIPVGVIENSTNISPYERYYSSGAAEYYNGRNGFRLLNNHRLDAGFTYTKKKKRHTKIWNFSVYNAYSRNNPFYYFYQTSYNYNTQRTTSELRGLGLLPFIPTISYNFKF